MDFTIHFHWEPLLIVAAGLLHYWWYKRVNPYPEDFIDRMDRLSLSGSAGYAYRPESGIAGAIMGFLFLIFFNWSWLMQWF